MKFFSSFWWCLVNALLCLYVLAVNIQAGNEGWTWAMVACILYWAWAGRRALKRTEIDEHDAEYNEDQKARITVAVKALGKVIEEVESECKAATLARKLKAREKGDDRTGHTPE